MNILLFYEPCNSSAVEHAILKYELTRWVFRYYVSDLLIGLIY